jgi:CRISPR/Cas system CSM-associated protein Csm3 (group 7 of RAMP superfamily)
MANQFQSRVVLTGHIRCKTGARIHHRHDAHGREERHQGEHRQEDSGRRSADLYALKDLSGLPFISGSNFKNFLRREVESLLRETLGPGFSCDTFNRDKACIRLGEPKVDGGVYLQDLLELCHGDDEQLSELIEKHTCIACKLFGSQLDEPRIIVDDLKPSVWSVQFNSRKRLCAKHVETAEPEEKVPNKFLIRVVLSNCEPWKRGLFIMGLSRAQNKLITLSTGRQSEPRVAMIDGLSIRSLESARQYYERLSRLEATDGEEVTTEQLQHWIASLRDYLKLVAGFALAS